MRVEQSDRDHRARHRDVDRGDERGRDLAAAVGRRDPVQVVLCVEEPDSVARPGQDGGDEQERQRAERRRRDEAGQAEREQRDPGLLRPPRGDPVVRGHLGGARRGQHQRGDRAEQGQVRRAEQRRGVGGHDREEERDGGPEHGRRQGDPGERPPDVGGHRRARDLPAATAPPDRLRDAEREQRYRGGRGQQHNVGQPQRGGRPLGQQARDEGAGAAAARLRQPGQQRGPAGVAVGLELDQRRRRRARRHTDGETLERAPGEEPCGALGEREHDQPGRARAQAHQEHDPASEPVGQLPEQHERRNEHEGVKREHRGQDSAREPEPLAVDGVERRRQVHARHQHHPRDPDDHHRAGGAAGRDIPPRCPLRRPECRGQGHPRSVPRPRGPGTSRPLSLAPPP
jgi:hypothetical protein